MFLKELFTDFTWGGVSTEPHPKEYGLLKLSFNLAIPVVKDVTDWQKKNCPPVTVTLRLDRSVTPHESR